MSTEPPPAVTEGEATPANKAPTVGEYDATLKAWQQLVDIRFKLLALTPIATGLGLKEGSKSIAFAAVGLVAALSIVMYEARNSQLHDNAVHRLKQVEKELKMTSSTFAGHSGVIGDIRAGAPLRTVGGLRMVHDRALGGIYGAVVGVWTSLLARLGADGLDTSGALRDRVGAGAGLVTAVATALAIVRLSRRGRIGTPVELKELGRFSADAFRSVLDLGAVNARARVATVKAELALPAVHRTSATSRRRVGRRQQGFVTLAQVKALDVAERLGLVETRPGTMRRRRTEVREDWWLATKPDDLVERIGLANYVTPVGSRYDRRVRLTGMGRLWLARSVDDDASEERRKLLMEHLESRVSGFRIMPENLKLRDDGLLDRTSLDTLQGHLTTPASLNTFKGLLEAADLLAKPDAGAERPNADADVTGRATPPFEPSSAGPRDAGTASADGETSNEAVRNSGPDSSRSLSQPPLSITNPIVITISTGASASDGPPAVEVFRRPTAAMALLEQHCAQPPS